MFFKNAIVRKPARSIVDGISSADLRKPIYEKALQQHEKYVEVLRGCGLDVTVLEPENEYPDSTFVEDPAVLSDQCSVITRPGAESRKGEERLIKNVLTGFYDNIEEIKSPGTLEGGDVMQVGKHFYVGISARTNRDGARQLKNILEKYDYKLTTVELKHMLHLKTGVSYLGNNTLVAAGEFIDKEVFTEFKIIKIDEEEQYAANCIRINDYVIIPEGYPVTREKIERAGFSTRTVDMSEFRKIDGGLSCLSLRL